ncbi:hypothetical protein YC2023_004893 [Brassica napus]
MIMKPSKAYYRAFVLNNVIFSVGLNGNIRGRISRASENKPCSNLVIIEETLVRLVNKSRHNFAGTA